MATPQVMTREIRVDVKGISLPVFMMLRSTAPKGVKVGGLMSEALNTIDGRDAALYFMVTVELVKPFVQDVVKDAAKDLAKDWLVKFLTNLKPERIRIQGREPKDQIELERFAAEELEIGKND
jgi:hypothetical protein